MAPAHLPVVATDEEGERRERFPFCVIWTSIPLISWLVPVIGHIGICRSDGVSHDFAGPYFISVDQLAFGHAMKYWRLDLSLVRSRPNMSAEQTFDACIEEGMACYEKMMYNFFCNNCHSYVARCLNLMEYGGRKDWTMFRVWLHLTMHSRFVSGRRFLESYGVFLVLVTLAALIAVLVKTFGRFWEAYRVFAAGVVLFLVWKLFL
eukprot:tig00020965_g16832.t1